MQCTFLKHCKLRLFEQNLRCSSLIYGYFEKGCRENVQVTIPKGNMGYVQYTVPDTVTVKPTVVAFLYHSQTYVHGLSCHSFKFL